MAARLTDRKRKQIIADYVEIGSYNAVAKKHKVSKDTVRRAVAGCANFAQKAQQKKDQSTADILTHMEKNRDKVCLIMDAYLDALLSPAKIASATTSQLTTALGTLIDKFTMAGVAAQGQDDGFVDALNKSAKEAWEDEAGDIPV